MELGLVLWVGVVLVLGVTLRLLQKKNAALAKMAELYTLLFRFNTILMKQQPMFQDTVTNLVAWPVFQDRLNVNLKLSERHQLMMAVMYIDLDHFKVINDALSVQVGDELLKEVAERLQSCIRQVDSITRPNKDIFVVQLTRLVKPETAAIVAQRMLHALARPYIIGEQALNVSASIGIALYPQDGADTVSLLKAAEHALKVAKNKGRQAYQFYQSEMHAESVRELMIYNVIASDELFQSLNLFYQPIMKMRDNHLEVMEVLCYLNHPTLGLISEEDTLKYALQQHRMNAVSEWILEKALRQYLNWSALGFSPRLLGIPVLMQQFENSQFVYRVSQLIQQLRFNPSDLVLLIQDTGTSVPLTALEKSFNMLSYLGVKVALDQHETSRLPFFYLKHFGFHYVRVEKSLAADVLTNAQTRALLSSMVLMARNLSMQLIVPGVETEEQKNLLIEMGIELMEGTALGVPESERVIAERLTTG